MGGKKHREGGKIVILSTSTSTQIPTQKPKNNQNNISKQNSKQAIRQGKVEKNGKMFANPVFITSGRIKNLF